MKLEAFDATKVREHDIENGWKKLTYDGIDDVEASFNPASVPRDLAESGLKFSLYTHGYLPRSAIFASGERPADEPLGLLNSNG